ncbi:MAG: YchJ family protein [Spirochaetales bacterium]|nr:YchJ family protein [Spirochaetales bacterium]
MSACPCGSKKDYRDCCAPYLEGKDSAATAEALMRSRYTAYVKGNIDYIVETHTPKKRDTLSVEDTRDWATQSKWLGLTIISTEAGGVNDSGGTVEFTAKYELSGKINDHHEKSTFEKINGTWYFCEGKVFHTTIVNAGPKISRNAPCPCGSGKKYKHCCG